MLNNKQTDRYKTKIKSVFYATLSFLLFWSIAPVSALAQSLSQHVIGSAGTFVTSSQGSMSWTIGEITIETYSSSNHFLTQGFHQPNNTTTEYKDFDFFIPQGFSPNGDRINDLFIIRGILNYPNNSIVIFNRWGNEVFKANPYTNTWNGTSTTKFSIGEDELPVGTYFYLLDLRDGSSVIKGFIYLNK